MVPRIVERINDAFQRGGVLTPGRWFENIFRSLHLGKPDADHGHDLDSSRVMSERLRAVVEKYFARTEPKSNQTVTRVRLASAAEIGSDTGLQRRSESLLSGRFDPVYFGTLAHSAMLQPEAPAFGAAFTAAALAERLLATYVGGVGRNLEKSVARAHREQIALLRNSHRIQARVVDQRAKGRRLSSIHPRRRGECAVSGPRSELLGNLLE